MNKVDKTRNAAIILLGMGDKHAADILKNMNPKEVQVVIDAMNKLGNVSERDVIQALNAFFKEANNNAGIDEVSKERIKNQIVSAIGLKGIDGIDSDKIKWLDLLKYEPMANIVDMVQDEHPQIITAIIVILTHQNSEKASNITKMLPKPTQKQVIDRMTHIGSISSYAIDALSDFFEKQLEGNETYSTVAVDGVEAVANIISYLDSATEREIISDISNTDKEISEKIQDKLFPFEKLTTMDNKSLQTFLKEVAPEDLTLALKGADELIRNLFMKGMSSKAAEILKDDMESMGPVKLAKVVEAQKRMIVLAKKLAEEEKINLGAGKPGESDTVM